MRRYRFSDASTAGADVGSSHAWLVVMVLLASSLFVLSVVTGLVFAIWANWFMVKIVATACIVSFVVASVSAALFTYKVGAGIIKKEQERLNG